LWINLLIPIQRIIFAGSVRNWKTTEGGASIKISLISGSTAKATPRLLFRFTF
jgi:hypothetical protein